MLLAGEDARQDVAEKAQGKLLEKIEQDVNFFKKKFSKLKAKKAFGAEFDHYRIHDMKFGGSILGKLRKYDLAWQTYPNDSSWWSLHPSLGKAVMATIAIAIANFKGLDIVTDEFNAHRSVCTQNDDHVFQELVGDTKALSPTLSDETVDEVAQLVVTTRFDVSKLSVRQIVELQKDGKDLRQFKDAIVPIADTIPDIQDPAERKKRLEQAADAVIEKWRDYSKSLPQFALDALMETAQLKTPKDDILAFGFGLGSYLPFGSITGITVALVSYSGIKVWRKYQESKQSPLRYLSRIHRAGASLAVPVLGKYPLGFFERLVDFFKGDKI